MSKVLGFMVQTKVNEYHDLKTSDQVVYEELQDVSAGATTYSKVFLKLWERYIPNAREVANAIGQYTGANVVEANDKFVSDEKPIYQIEAPLIMAAKLVVGERPKFQQYTYCHGESEWFLVGMWILSKDLSKLIDEKLREFGLSREGLYKMYTGKTFASTK